jgi:hypothetical protein
MIVFGPMRGSAAPPSATAVACAIIALAAGVNRAGHRHGRGRFAALIALPHRACAKPIDANWINRSAGAPKEASKDFNTEKTGEDHGGHGEGSSWAARKHREAHGRW